MSDTELEIDKDDFSDASTTFPQKFKISEKFSPWTHPVKHLGNWR